MKKIISIMVMLLFSASLMAQEHLSFKGIPITGNLSSFCQQLKNKGFTMLGKSGNVTVLEGLFTGQKSTVVVTSTDNGEDVFAVAVIFGSDSAWNKLVKTYDYYKDLYTRKYGTPTISKEENPSTDNSNTALMFSLNEGQAVYASLWEVTGGEIELSIQKAEGSLQGMVVIRYRDKQNVKEKIESDMEEI